MWYCIKPSCFIYICYYVSYRDISKMKTKTVLIVIFLEIIVHSITILKFRFKKIVIFITVRESNTL